VCRWDLSSSGSALNANGVTLVSASILPIPNRHLM
jgi:hypothetical protein